MNTRKQAREARRLRSRRIRAILAGGLVLGIGTAWTLATWNDSEYGTATFQAGRFDIVGSVDGGANFASHPSSGTAAALSFSVPVAAMAPGNTTYSLFIVKTASTSVKGQVQFGVASTAGTGLAPFLTYGVRLVGTGVACDAAGYAGASASVIVADGSLLSAGSGVQTPIDANGGGTGARYCIAITLPGTAGNGAQGLTAIQTWQVTGTST